MFVTVIPEPSFFANFLLSAFIFSFIKYFVAVLTYPFSVASTPALSIATANAAPNATRNPPDCTILDSCVLGNFTLANKLFVNAVWNLKTCLSVNNNLCKKLV